MHKLGREQNNILFIQKHKETRGIKTIYYLYHFKIGNGVLPYPTTLKT